MNILVLNGSPRPNGNTAAMVEAFAEGASENLKKTEMIVLASPVYYHGFTGQLQCAINRIYALDKPKKLKKAALFLSSRSDDVYSGAIYEYQNSFPDYLKLEDMGIFTAFGKQNKSEEKLDELREFGQYLR